VSEPVSGQVTPAVDYRLFTVHAVTHYQVIAITPDRKRCSSPGWRSRKYRDRGRRAEILIVCRLPRGRAWMSMESAQVLQLETNIVHSIAAYKLRGSPTASTVVRCRFIHGKWSCGCRRAWKDNGNSRTAGSSECIRSQLSGRCSWREKRS